MAQKKAPRRRRKIVRKATAPLTRSRGRPSIYSQEKVDQLCDLIATGWFMTDACKELGLSRMTVYYWAREKPEFAESLKTARRNGCAWMAEEMFAIADGVTRERGWDIATVAAARLQTDIRRWVLSRLAPDEYGDQMRLSGRDGTDLVPRATPEARIPRLMAILAAVMPERTNGELHAMASDVVARYNESSGVFFVPDDQES